MPQTAALIDTLKQALKAGGKTYVDVAEALDLSEASVKRMFASQHFSLARLDRVCQLLQIEISDLVQQMNERQTQVQELSEAQEKQIVDDLELLLVTVCALNRWTLPEIVQHYTLTEHQVIRKLAQLDRLRVIELLPGNRIKLLVAPNFNWRRNGPIERFFKDNVGHEFFNVRFSGDQELLLVLNGMLSAPSNGELQRKLQRLAREFNDLNNDDAGLPLDDRSGVTMVLALRHWHYGVFAKYRAG